MTLSVKSKFTFNPSNQKQQLDSRSVVQISTGTNKHQSNNSNPSNKMLCLQKNNYKVYIPVREISDYSGKIIKCWNIVH